MLHKKNSHNSLRLRSQLLALVFIFSTLIGSFIGPLALVNTAKAAPPATEAECKAVGDTWYPANASNQGRASCAGPATCKAEGGVWNTVPKSCTFGSSSRVSDMGATEQAKSWLYYNALSACINNGSVTGSVRSNTTSVQGVTDGKWFNSGQVNPAIGFPLGAMGVKVNGFPSSDSAEKVECGGENIAWISDAFKLWGYSNNLDAWCSVTGALTREDGTICSGSSSSKGWVAASATKALKNNFQTVIKNRVYGGGEPTRPDPAKYAHAKAAFYGACLRTASPTPYTGGERGETVFENVAVVDSATGAKTSAMYAGAKKKSDSVWWSISPNGNNITETCANLVSEMNKYADAYSRNIIDRIDSGLEPDRQEAVGSGGNLEGDSTTSCAIEGVGWIVCPVVNFMATIADSAFTFLSDNFLQVDTNTLQATDSNATYQVWSTMRTIANVVFVICFLIIIFSQLTGQGIANYGIKKMLPRIIIAAILVNVSFFICQIAVDLSNILGVTLKSSFEEAGANLGVYNSDPATPPNTWQSLAGGLLVTTGAVAGAWALGASVLIPMLIGAVIALVMVFFILIVRQMLIILLVILAPIAFVAFLLPNTEQWFTKWRKTFVALLMVFPIIGLLFGGSSLVSSVLMTVYTGAGGGNSIGKIVAAGILVLPLFLLPALLKGSLNAVGNIGGKINGIGDRFGKGARSRSSNSGALRSLANKKQRSRAAIGAGIYSGRNPISNMRSAVNSRLNRSDKFNAVTGDYGTARGANIDRLEGEETKLAESAVRLQERNGTGVEAQLEAAVAKGDVVRAIAAQNVLMGKGGPGINGMRTQLGKSMSSEMSSALSSNIMQNHAQAAKAKGNDVLKWAQKGGVKSIDEITARADTWGSLTAHDLAGQTDHAFEKAVASGGVSSETIEALNSERMRGELTDEKRKALLAIASRQTAAAPTAQASTTPTTTTSPAAPQAGTPALGAQRPEQRQYSREQIQQMGAENAQRIVDTRGGYDNLHEGDLLAIRNAYGGTELGNGARQEAINRGLVQEPPAPRDPGTMPRQQ